MGEQTSKIKNFIFGNFGVIVVFIVAIAYLFYGLIEIDETGKTVTEIIMASGIAFMVGYSITQLLLLQGLIWGNKDQSVIDTKKAHGKTIASISDDIELLDYFCEDKTKDTIRIARISILSRVGLKYANFFDENGDVIEENINIPISNDEIIEKRNKTKRKAINDAIYVKIEPLTTDSLTTDNGVINNPYKFHDNQQTYQKKSAQKGAIMKVIMGIGFGYYGIELIRDFNWGYVLYTAIQLAIFLLNGGIRLIVAWFYVTDTLRQDRVKKINSLEQFRNTDKTKYREMHNKIFSKETVKEENTKENEETFEEETYTTDILPKLSAN